MMSDSNLNRSGLYFDDQNKIRIFDPKLSQYTANLINECSEFINNTTEFKSVVDDYVKLVDTLKEKVEKEKIKALGSRNALESATQKKESDRKHLISLINEKKHELSRLTTLEQSLVREEAEQKDLMEKLTSYR
ncbi:intraflagellar transport protein 20 homolog B-like [Brevipalpus obovatus]|uniref:intraflagellar transport protein 20 homolog B-like n=1 Tax=Brevipalpus obovatus TaxID=246614 RepID=UPI003D9DF41C